MFNNKNKNYMIGIAILAGVCLLCRSKNTSTTSEYCPACKA